MEESKRGFFRNTFENLAQEIVSDILLRLPIEGILTCKCVCKYWYNITKDNYFVKLQLGIANNRPSSRIILVPEKENIRHEFPKLPVLDTEEHKARYIPGFPFAEAKKSRYKMGTKCSLDGLICLAPSRFPDPVVIYNPLLAGDYITLPKTMTNRKLRYIRNHVTLGFDPLINKYKAVRVLSYEEDLSGDIGCLCEVITIGGDGEEASWRQVVDPCAGKLQNRLHDGVFYQGSIYWIIDPNVRRGTPNNREYILEFDLTKEVFRVVRYLDSMREFDLVTFMNFKSQLQILGGDLGLMLKFDRHVFISRIFKENGNNLYIRYNSVKLKAVPKAVRVTALLREPINGGVKDFYFLLEIPQGRRWKDEARKRRETQFLYYYPKTHQSVKFSSLEIKSEYKFVGWHFKPTLVSAKALLPSNS